MTSNTSSFSDHFGHSTLRSFLLIVCFSVINFISVNLSACATFSTGCLNSLHLCCNLFFFENHLCNTLEGILNFKVSSLGLTAFKILETLSLSLYQSRQIVRALQVMSSKC